MRFRSRSLFLFVLCSIVLAALAPGVHAAGGGVATPAAPKPAPVYVPPGWPKVLTIPRFGVKASVEALKFVATADIHAPYKWGDVAWYNRGPRPGDSGRATIFGHLDSFCCPAVFWQLHSLRPGDIVQVAYKTGKLLNFRVMWQGTYLNSKLPLKYMFGNTKEHGLSLITCTGVFHRDGTGYDHKLLVYTRLVLPSGKLG